MSGLHFNFSPESSHLDNKTAIMPKNYHGHRCHKKSIPFLSNLQLVLIVIHKSKAFNITYGISIANLVNLDLKRRTYTSLIQDIA